MTTPREPAAGWDLAGRRLYLCTPDRPDLEPFVEACLDGGVDIVQLREKSLANEQLARRAALVQRICSDHGVPFIVNDLPELAAAIGADGVHVGQDDMAPTTARSIMGDRAIIGLSTHSPEQFGSALGEDRAQPGSLGTGSPATGPVGTAVPVDYISAGPVVPTPTKPGRPGTGLGYVTEAARRSPWPVWVTGGVDPATVTGMIAAGARHFVVVRWLTGAGDPREHARVLRRVIDDEISRADQTEDQTDRD
jgi:thiamine-phosphate pyrophosphorylase